jgi:hypothetical protein
LRVDAFDCDYAASWYSWISPPSRSRRRRRSRSITSASGCSSLSGDRCPSARCGRCSLKCEDQQPVEALAANASDPALGVRPRLRRPYRRLDHPDALGAEDLVKIVRELAVAITNQEPRADALVAEFHEQVAGLLGHPAAVGVGGDPGEVNAPARQLDEEQDIETLQEETGGKGSTRRGPENGFTGPQPLPPAATGCRLDRMVSRASAVGCRPLREVPSLRGRRSISLKRQVLRTRRPTGLDRATLTGARAAVKGP